MVAFGNFRKCARADRATAVVVASHCPDNPRARRLQCVAFGAADSVCAALRPAVLRQGVLATVWANAAARSSRRMRCNDCFDSRCRCRDGEAMMPLPDILGEVCWIAATVGSFLICRMIYQRLGQPLLHPVLWSTMVLVVLIGITHHPLSAYRQETAPLGWLLGPAV